MLEELMNRFIILITCLMVFPMHAWAQTDPIYINGPYYVSAGQTEQWYGDVTLGPNAELYIEDGQQVLFYGAHFKALPGAKIYGANTAWTSFTQGAGTGSIVFSQPNPNNASTVQQTLDGGWTPAQGNSNTLTSITINNPLGVKLVNTDSRVGTNLNFTTATTGNLYVDANDMRLGTAATITNYNQNNNFVVTASTGHLVKEFYTGAFTFPVGMADNDYTPAQITNTTANGIHVNVTDYTGSASVETGTNGIDRTWNIYADNAAGNSTINLQHNNTTNQADFSEASNFVARYSSLPNNNTGDYGSLSPWQSNIASASGAGSLTTGATIAAGKTNFRIYTGFATTAADQLAYYTKRTCIPPTVAVTDPAAVCSPSTADLTVAAVTAGSDTGLTYTYYSDAAGTVTLVNANAVSASGNYYIKGYNGTCYSDLKPVHVIVNPLPTATISYPGSPYCATGTATVALTDTTGGAFSSSPGLSIDAATGDIDLASSTAGIYTVTYNFADAATGCSNSTTTPVTIRPVATAGDIYVADVIVCPGNSATLTATSSAVSSPVFKWYADAALTQWLYTGATYATPVLNTTTIYYVTVENSSTCPNNPSKQVIVAMGADCGSITPSGCSVNGSLLFMEDFGGNATTDPSSSSIHVPQMESPPYPYGLVTVPDIYDNNNLIDANQYAVVKKGQTHWGFWYQYDDHTYPGDADRGYFLAINADYQPGKFYDATLDNLCAGTQLYFSSWIANLSKSEFDLNPNLKYVLFNQANDTLATFSTGNIAGADSTWRQYGFNFTVPAGVTSLHLKIFNNTPGGGGTDLALDDIGIYACLPSVTNTSSKTSYCAGDNMNLSINFADDGTYGSNPGYQWYYSSTGDLTSWSSWSSISGGNTANLTTTAIAGFYRVVVGDPNNIALGKFNCLSSSNPLQVIVNPLPTATITGLAEACTGDRALFATGTFPSYQWSIVSGTGGAMEGAGTTNPAYFSWNMTGQKVVKVTVTNIEGCVGEAQATIDVKQRASTGPMYRLPNKQ